LAAGHEQLAPVIARIVEPFLESMVARGFLSCEADSPNMATKQYEGSTSGDPKLEVLYLHLTNRCNLRCVYCYNARQRQEGRENCRTGGVSELRRDEILDVLDQARAMGAETAVFTGGEPLLRLDARELGGYARSLGFATNLLTNGTLITADNAADIVAAFDLVIVSLDSFVKSEHESMRPGASFESVVNGIKLLMANGVRALAIRPVISNTNLRSLPLFPAYAEKQFGCKTWAVAKCIPNSPEELEQLDRFVAPDVYLESMRQFRRALGDREGRMLKGEYPLEGAGACGAGAAILSVAATGEVYPCQNLHFPEYQAGNVREQSLRSILHDSPALKVFRDGQPPWFDGCAGCALSPLCGSVCRVYHHNFKQREQLFMEKMCPLLRADLDDKLWSEVEMQTGSTSSL
jgi:radical SAM protein with 4Fe4S-binding SPASM domain